MSDKISEIGENIADENGQYGIRGKNGYDVESESLNAFNTYNCLLCDGNVTVYNNDDSTHYTSSYVDNLGNYNWVNTDEIGCITGETSSCWTTCYGGCYQSCDAGCTQACTASCTTSCTAACTTGCTAACTTGLTSAAA